MRIVLWKCKVKLQGIALTKKTLQKIVPLMDNLIEGTLRKSFAILRPVVETLDQILIVSMSISFFAHCTLVAKGLCRKLSLPWISKSRVLLVPFFGQKSKVGPPFLESNYLILCPLQFTLSFRSAIYLPGTQSSIPKSLQSSKFFSKDWSSSNSIKQLSSNLCTLYCLLSYSTCVGHSKEEFRG